ncbi:helix-turn-helix transcriptional regulator [Novosphingobium sp. G106]|uniref:winged helix-turn-helix transcriptional regulator n=1 Tax=Novosphingobium sp. G106 TaxID=2849500 RepID=UPI001C2DEC2D|nr:helix-turn-helix domain-containing protein [Novosphingobium sp. G106]MBV1686108.1 helix-turn-helix transcriptional regulator [Novosphingobium sp. G106]
MKLINRLPGLPAERALKILSGRWKAVLLHTLLEGPQRTCDLQNRIAGISQKVLIEQLRAFEEHGMLVRQDCAVHEQGVEYLLTPLGQSMRPILEALIDWRAHHAHEVGEGHRLFPCEAVVGARTAKEGSSAPASFEAVDDVEEPAAGQVDVSRRRRRDAKQQAGPGVVG